MKYFYHFIGIIYSSLIKLAVFFSPKARMMQRGRWRLWARLRQRIEPGTEYIWVHAASLGEFEQGRPLIERIKAEYPEERILLTFFSPSGYEVRKNYDLADVVCYLPGDSINNARRFIRQVNPKMAIFIKYDFWPCFLLELRRLRIRTYLVSATFRPSQLFFKWYGGIYKALLKCFTKLYVQDEASKILLAKHGITEVEITGDTRLDRVISVSNNQKPRPLFEVFRNSTSNPIIVAGSTWPPDEEILLRYFNAHPEVKLILAPHEINKPHLLGIISHIKRPFVRLSEAQLDTIADQDCIIIDSFGLLSSVYRFGNLAYIGGGFGKGIHNTPEAAVYGLPVLFGPRYHKFKEAIGLIESGGAFCINSLDEFTQKVNHLFSDAKSLNSSGKASHDYIFRNAGATERILADIFDS
ncbi:3-deoxy-D-manno-octulosonic acid transferase [Porphyromonas crevioricanis]|uniref:3-deoxy-D-manno-octulosonic acid transferase n=2 Tax=Porphyromonas crevioricanis TaxID=393921 RepID=A0A0A2FGE8_9PORP|nr:glycosyltransferase N-terminal domain-containing protein [Porphyromonas crevioricanis]KGN90068.1 3-deoxy-D-manno-octulosonic acid transferase [Porphyromonas crevioricanis]GAD07341.1 3-deoxy-D-manno-octulosonic-acid transferase [Porphyromonas crevioricanis JCM 13913]SJZ69637.1 3-deoxy-D-manno-octulosonic-acid transferase [Porphyromonas crevioricanis]SQH72275.1 3-deoxy-D-manno-octulosonic-acid transferase [Porphyromonas crevioricanis]